MKRVILLPLLLFILVIAGSAGAQPSFPDTIALPDGFFPEGIVVGRGSNFYVGSLVNGAVYQGDLRNGETVAISAGLTDQLAVGLAFDQRTNYVYAAGGPGLVGKVAIYDGDGLELLHNITLTQSAGFVNDVIISKDAAYLTDSFVPVLYRLGLENGMPNPSDISTIQLIGFDSAAGFNANGIVSTASGQWLIVVNSATGVLYRVDPTTGVSTPIDLGGRDVTSGDGLVLSGNTLYVVQNALQRVAVFKMGDNFSSGKLLRVIELPGSETPTTADLFGSGLYLVDARFNTPPGANVNYEVTRVAK